MAEKTLKELGYTTEVNVNHVSIKEPVFPFNKFSNPDIFLRPQMRSTGEVMGIAGNFGTAIIKASRATGMKIPMSGTVFMSINEYDKPACMRIALQFGKLGFKILATKGTHRYLKKFDIESEIVKKVVEGKPNVVDLIKENKINLIINTPLGKASTLDEYAIGRNAIKYNIPCITTITGADAFVKGIGTVIAGKNHKVMCLQEFLDMA